MPTKTSTPQSSPAKAERPAVPLVAPTSVGARLGNQNMQSFLQPQGDVLRFRSTGEIVTRPRLIEWAMAQKIPQPQLIAEILSSHRFAGSADAREGAAIELTLALREKSLVERRKQADQAIHQKLQMQKDAERRHKADSRSSRAYFVKNRRGQLESAMSALGDIQMLSLYKEMRGLNDIAAPENPALDSLLRRSRRTAFAQQLKLHNLEPDQFSRRVHAFEETFREAACDLAIDALDVAKDLGQEHLDDFGKTAELSRSMSQRLAPVRKPALSLLDQAAELRTKAAMMSGDAWKGSTAQMRAEVDAVKAEAEEAKTFALELVAVAFDGLPFVRLPEFPLEAVLRAADADEIRQLVYRYLNGYMRDLDEARKALEEDSGRIYSHDLALAAAMETFHIADGSIFALIIRDSAKAASASRWIGKLKTLLTFALVVASIVVPGAILTTGSVVITAISGVHDAWEAIAQYDRDHAAFAVGLQSTDPSVIWVLVELISAVLAVRGALSLLKGEPAALLREALERFSRSRDLEQLSHDLSKIRGLSPQLREAIEARARLLKGGTYGNPSRQLAAGPQPPAPVENAPVGGNRLGPLPPKKPAPANPGPIVSGQIPVVGFKDPHPAIIYLDPWTHNTWLITVHDGHALYRATGVHPFLRYRGKPTDVLGEFYIFSGMQEGRHSLFQQGGMFAFGRGTPFQALRDTPMIIEGRAFSPRELNDWLRTHGAPVFTDYDDFLGVRRP